MFIIRPIEFYGVAAAVGSSLWGNPTVALQWVTVSARQRVDLQMNISNNW